MESVLAGFRVIRELSARSPLVDPHQRGKLQGVTASAVTASAMFVTGLKFGDPITTLRDPARFGRVYIRSGFVRWSAHTTQSAAPTSVMSGVSHNRT